MNLSNEEIFNRVQNWQNAGFVHELTCGKDSTHRKLVPAIKVNPEGSVVVLKCDDCDYVQNHIPETVLEFTDKRLKENKERLEALGFKF